MVGVDWREGEDVALLISEVHSGFVVAYEGAKECSKLSWIEWIEYCLYDNLGDIDIDLPGDSSFKCKSVVLDEVKII